MALVGDIKELPLPDIIQINCLGRNVARLLVRFPVGDGVFYFQDGEIYDARLGQYSGVKAIYEALKYEQGSFRIDASVTTSERTIFKSWAEVLMDAMRLLDEENAGKSPHHSYANFDPQAFLARQTIGIPVAGKQIKDYIGKIINDKYRIISKIKEGELGVMYKATHIQMDVPVAIKIMHPYLVNDQSAVERFRRGAHAAAKIHHPNAINVLDFGITRDEVVYLAMEYLNGETFRERLQHQHRLLPKEMLKIVRPICSALEAAHRDQIVHRDLKPENIMIYESGGEELVKVLDFGMAKLKSLGTEGVLTSHGLVLGTHNYVSPELCEGADIDHRSDIYALGVILYESLTGSLPFNDPTPVGMALKHIGSKPNSMRSLCPEIPVSIDDVVMKALEKKPSNRQQSALELAKDFEQAVNFREMVSSLPRRPANNNANNFSSESFDNQTPLKYSSPDELDVRSRVPKANMPYSPQNPPNIPSVSGNESKYSQPEPSPLRPIPPSGPTGLETKPLNYPKSVNNVVNNVVNNTVNEYSEPSRQPLVETPPNTNVSSPKKKSKLLESNLVLFFLSALIGGLLFFLVLFILQLFNNTQKTADIIVTPEMVKIPGGSFVMGRDVSKDVPLEQTPSHQVMVKTFFLSRYEITNKQYQEFVRKTNYRSPLGWVGTDFPNGAEDLPVVNVTWEDAQYYCQWLSKVKKESYRLPTEEEWEYAASGTENRLYPWGNDLEKGNTVYSDTSLGVTAPINSSTLASDKSPFGIIGLSGNVSEWTADSYRPYAGTKAKIDCNGCYTVRGGNFKSSANDIVAPFRFGSAKSSDFIGFRVAKN
jgi:serine/threonine protein kinase